MSIDSNSDDSILGVLRDPVAIDYEAEAQLRQRLRLHGVLPAADPPQEINVNHRNDNNISDDETISSEMISQMLRVEQQPAENAVNQDNLHHSEPHLPELMNQELPLPNSSAKDKAGSIPKEPDAESLSSDDSGPLHPDDIWGARNGEMPDERTASLAFATAQGMFFFSFISEIGTFQDVAGDGNCFFYAILLGAYYNRIHPYYIEEPSEKLRLLHLARYVFDNTTFRRSMHSFLQDNIMKFCSDDPNERCLNDSTGGKHRDFVGNSERVLNRIGQKLYEDGVDFYDGCTFNYWADVNRMIPVAAFFLKMTIVVYWKARPTQKDLSEIYFTTVAYYEDDNVTMHFLEGEQFYAPPSSVPKICLWYDGIHYQHIILYEYDLPTFKWRHFKACHAKKQLPNSSIVQHQTPTKPHNDDGDCDIVDEQGSTSSDIADPSIASLRYTSKVVLGQRSPKSKHMEKRETVGSVHYVHFHPVTDEIIIIIKSEVLIGKIVASHDANKLTSYGFAPGLKHKGALFKDLMNASGSVPAHIDLRCQNSTTVSLPSGRGRRSTQHSYLIKFDGTCSQNVHKRSKKKSKDDMNGPLQCTTTWVGGIDHDNLLLFAKEPLGSQIELGIKIQGRCCHREDKVYGQVRGAKRQEVIKEVMEQKKKPKEFARYKLMNTSPEKFDCNNLSGVASTAHMVSRMKVEGKLAANNKKGIVTGDCIGNVLRAKEITSAQDLGHRESIGDNSKVMPGVARTVNLVPNIEVHLHSRRFLYLAGKLSSMGRLVLHIDGTGGMINFRNTKHDGKIQHLLLQLQLSECVLDKQTAEQVGAKLFTSVVIAERVSNTNTTSAIANWLSVVRDDTWKAMSSYDGCSHPMKLKPSVIKMDCALEEFTGCLKAFRLDNQVATAQQYNAIIMIVCLRYESVAKAGDESQQQQIAQEFLKQLRQYVPCVIKQCKTHVSSAIRRYPRKSNDGDTPMRKWSHQVDALFKHVAKVATTVTSMSEVIVRLSVIVTIFTSKTIKTGRYNKRSCTQEHHDDWQSKSIANTMADMIRDLSATLQIDSVEEYARQLSAVNVGEKTTANAPFTGSSFAQQVIDVMLGQGGKNELPMPFAVPYLKEVHGNTGTVGICYVYSPYGDDDDQLSESLENQTATTPKRTGGVTVQVNLPHKSSEVPNPLYCPAAADYILEYWLGRPGLWCESSLRLTKIAMDANIFSCNNSIESKICSEKHHVSSVRDDTSDLASLIHRRQNDVDEFACMVSKEIDGAASRIDGRKKRKAVKEEKKQEAVKKKKDVDEMQVEEVMETEMLWRKTPGTVRGKNEMEKERMVRALERGAAEGRFQYKGGNMKDMWRVLECHSSSVDSDFMSYDSFRIWMNGDRKKELEPEWLKVLNSFHATYVDNVDN